MAGLLDVCSRIREHHQAEKHEGVLIDAFTASAIMTVAHALKNPENRAKLDDMHPVTAARVCWKLLA